MVQYYVEGKPGQKHHLGNERLGEHSRAMAFRGNIYAYHLPWEMILASAAQSTSQDFLKFWPQPPEVVCNLIKVLLVNNTEEHTLAHLKQLHIRSFVLVGLARILIANGHEDMVKLGADPDASKAEQKEQAFKRYCDRVKHLYPPETYGDPDSEESNGAMLKEIAELAKANKSKAAAAGQHGPEQHAFQEKMR